MTFDGFSDGGPPPHGVENAHVGHHNEQQRDHVARQHNADEKSLFRPFTAIESE